MLLLALSACKVGSIKRDSSQHSDIDFLAVGLGRDLFGEQQDLAVQASLRLRRDMSDVACTAIEHDQFEATEQMIVEWADRIPLRDLGFARESIVPDFADSSRRSEDVAVAGKTSLAAVLLAGLVLLAFVLRFGRSTGRGAARDRA